MGGIREGGRREEGGCPTLVKRPKQLLYEFMTFYFNLYMGEMRRLVLVTMAEGHELVQQLYQAVYLRRTISPLLCILGS